MFYGVVSFMSITFSSCCCHLPLQSSSTCAAMLVHLPGADGKPRPLLNSFAQLVVAGQYHPVSISFNSFNIHQSLKNNIHQTPADGWYEAHYKFPWRNSTQAPHGITVSKTPSLRPSINSLAPCATSWACVTLPSNVSTTRHLATSCSSPLREGHIKSRNFPSSPWLKAKSSFCKRFMRDSVSTFVTWRTTPKGSHALAKPRER